MELSKTRINIFIYILIIIDRIYKFMVLLNIIKYPQIIVLFQNNNDLRVGSLYTICSIDAKCNYILLWGNCEGSFVKEDSFFILNPSIILLLRRVNS